MKDIITGFLRETADVIEYLSTYNDSPLINPPVFILASAILTFQASFTNNILGLLVPLLYSLLITILLRIDPKPVMKAEALILLFGLVVSLPVLFSREGYINWLNDLLYTPSIIGLYSFTKLLLRIIISPLPLLVAITYLGWINVVNVLKINNKYLVNLAKILSLTIILIPRIIRYVLKILLARTARLVKKNYSISWFILSSIIGDLLIHSSNYAEKLRYGIIARSIGEPDYSIRFKFSRNTITYLVLVVIAIIIEFIVMNNAPY